MLRGLSHFPKHLQELAQRVSSSADKPMGLRTAHSTSRERLSHSIIISVDGTVAYHSSPTKPFHIRQFWA